MHNQLLTLPCDLLLITIGYQLQMVAIFPTLTLYKVVQLRRDATCNDDTVYCWLCRWKNFTVKSMMFVLQGSRPMFLPVCHDDVWFTCDLKHLPLDICAVGSMFALQLLGDRAIVFSAAPLCACDNCLQLFFIPYYMYTPRLELCVSAFIGALYVDQGLASCTTFCQVCFFPRLKVSLKRVCVCRISLCLSASWLTDKV